MYAASRSAHNNPIFDFTLNLKNPDFGVGYNLFEKRLEGTGKGKLWNLMDSDGFEYTFKSCRGYHFTSLRNG
jgi:hypothetical protein